MPSNTRKYYNIPADIYLLAFIYINNISFNIIEISKDTNRIFINIFAVLYFLIKSFVLFIYTAVFYWSYSAP